MSKIEHFNPGEAVFEVTTWTFVRSCLVLTPCRLQPPVNRLTFATFTGGLGWCVLLHCVERCFGGAERSEEHTSELQSLMRISYAVFCLKKKHYTNIIS